MRKKDFKTPPKNDEIIVFKSIHKPYPEIGVYKIDTIVYIPVNDCYEHLVNIEWWSELPK